MGCTLAWDIMCAISFFQTVPDLGREEKSAHRVDCESNFVSANAQICLLVYKLGGPITGGRQEP